MPPHHARIHPTQERLRAAYCRCFSGPDGEIVLAHLISQSLQRALGPEVDEAALRHLEGQRALVNRIVALAKPPNSQSQE
jgi:hypothetical protein